MMLEKPLDLESHLWNNYKPRIERNHFECLSELNSVAVFSDSKLFPNSLLLLRKRSIRTECIILIGKKLKGLYHPYVFKEVVEALYGVIEQI